MPFDSKLSAINAELMLVSRSVHINAPVERVFALMCDPARRAGLNPAVTPLRVEIEGDGPLATGTICHFRLQTDSGIVDYHSRVREIVPYRKIVWSTDTAIPIEITLEVDAEDTGSRFTHSERFEPSAAMLETATPTSGGRFLQWLDGLLPFLDSDAAERLHAQREQRLEEKLGRGLERWLTAIRLELEGQSARPNPL